MPGAPFPRANSPSPRARGHSSSARAERGKQEITPFRFPRLSILLLASNRLLWECNGLLLRALNRLRLRAEREHVLPPGNTRDHCRGLTERSREDLVATGQRCTSIVVQCLGSSPRRRSCFVLRAPGRQRRPITRA